MRPNLPSFAYKNTQGIGTMHIGSKARLIVVVLNILSVLPIIFYCSAWAFISVFLGAGIMEKMPMYFYDSKTAKIILLIMIISIPFLILIIFSILSNRAISKKDNTAGILIAAIPVIIQSFIILSFTIPIMTNSFSHPNQSNAVSTFPQEPNPYQWGSHLKNNPATPAQSQDLPEK